VERTGDTGALEGLLGTVLGSEGHETGHLALGDLDLLAAEGGEGNVGNLEHRAKKD